MSKNATDWRWALARVETYGDLAFQFQGSLVAGSIPIRYPTVLKIRAKPGNEADIQLQKLATVAFGLTEGTMTLRGPAIVSTAKLSAKLIAALEAAWQTQGGGLIQKATPADAKAVARGVHLLNGGRQ